MPGDSSSDSDDDCDVVALAPDGYRFFEVDDKWPPAARYERPSTAAVPRISAPGSVTQLQGALSEALADEVYDYAVKTCDGQPWGGYLHLDDVIGEAEPKDAGMRLARECVRSLWLAAVPEKAPGLFQNHHHQEGHEYPEAASAREQLLKRVHGFEVWVLTGSEGNRCDYHIDFAEFQRYQHNLIFFPLYSATIQVARASMTGGEFTAHTSGLDHYSKIGYKGAHIGGAHKVEDHISSGDAGWRQIPYRFNQAIIIDGTIPHLSTRVESFHDAGKKRVIIATNVYDAVVGPRVRRFPIHSKQWQRVIKLNNILSKVSKSIANAASPDDANPNPATGTRAVGPYGEPLRAADTSAEEVRKDESHSRVRVAYGSPQRVGGGVPLGHTPFSWVPGTAGVWAVPVSHTAYSWSGARP